MFDAIHKLHEALPEAFLFHDSVEAATLAVIGCDTKLALQLSDFTVKVSFLDLIGTEECRTLWGYGLLGLALNDAVWLGALKRQVSRLGLSRHFNLGPSLYGFLALLDNLLQLHLVSLLCGLSPGLEESQVLILFLLLLIPPALLPTHEFDRCAPWLAIMCDAIRLLDYIVSLLSSSHIYIYRM